MLHIRRVLFFVRFGATPFCWLCFQYMYMLPISAKELTLADFAHLHDFVRVLVGADACSSAEASASLQRVLATRFTTAEAVAWRGQVKGTWRPLRANAPCNDTARWWVPSGAWHAHPMWAHCCNKGPSVLRCPGSVIEPPSHCDAHLAKALGGYCESDATLLCESFLPGADSNSTLSAAASSTISSSGGRGALQGSGSERHPLPLVYSFGVARQWTFEDWAGQRGFEVYSPMLRTNCALAMHSQMNRLLCVSAQHDHVLQVWAFDPTTNTRAAHEAHVARNVHFRYMGLGADGGSAAERRSVFGYGALGGEILALDGLRRRLGHTERSIRLMKVQSADTAELN